MSKPDVSRLMTVNEAVAAIDASPVVPQVTEVSLADAIGRRLAEDVRTDRDYPPFDKALMDGFAIRYGEPAGAFELLGEVPAGGGWTGEPLRGRQAVAIMTGAPMPPGEGDVGVVPVEQSRREGNMIHLEIAAEPGRHVSRRGEDRPSGEVILSKGTLLAPQHIAALATVGKARVKVFARPRCAVVATGNELVPVSSQPEGSQTRNSNTPMLVALLNRLGGEAFDAGQVGDDPTTTRQHLAEALASSDALFVTGGMSMGEHDYVWRTIAELSEVRVAKLRIRPGKPFVFGVSGERFIFGLPGNPVSAFVCTTVLASRLMTRLGGGDAGDSDRAFVGLPSAEPLPANGPRTFYQPARINGGQVMPLAWRGSADVFTLAEADALIERPENAPPCEAGEVVRVLRLP